MIKNGHNVSIFVIADMQIDNYKNTNIHNVVIELEKNDHDRHIISSSALWLENNDNRLFDTLRNSVEMYLFNNSQTYLERAIDEKSNQFWRIFNHKWDLVIVDELFCFSGYALALYNQQINQQSSYAIISTTFPFHYTKSFLCKLIFKINKYI